MNKITKVGWITIALCLIGAVIRIYHLFVIPFDQPFRLGGLFYEFSRQIIINDFALPKIIPYFSANGIPFAYPPLSFYVQAILLKIFSPPLFYSVNLIPPIISLFSLPAFYWMIKQYTGDIRISLFGLFAFALMPPAFFNQIEAAGMAESFGVLSIILYLGILFRWMKSPNWKDTVIAGIVLSFCILSSPGSAYAATLFSVVLFIWQIITGIRKQNLLPASMLSVLGVSGLFLSSPYWLSVMRNFGVDFFIEPILGQHTYSVTSVQIEQIIGFQPAGENMSFIWNGLILSGLIWVILKREFLIATIFIIFWIIPREGIWLVAIPGSILAGIGAINVFLPLFSSAYQVTNKKRLPLAPGILGVILFILVLANCFFSISVLITDTEWILNREDIEVLADFQREIPDDKMVIVQGNLAFLEWAPVLLQRDVLNIEYGLEWQPDELAKAVAIKSALEEGDLDNLILAIKETTDDQYVYLISTKTEIDRSKDLLQTNDRIKLVATTPNANLFILNIE